MMVRNARSRATRRNIGAQVGGSALVLLLPPIALGAAVYAMLPGREEMADRHVPNAVAEGFAAATDFRSPDGTPAAKTQPVAVAPPVLPPAAKPAVPAASAPPTFSLASARHEPSGKAAARDNASKDKDKDS